MYNMLTGSFDPGAAVREKASLAMTSLTLSDAGKQFAIKAKAVEGLCPLLDDENWKVRANAAGSIMSIAIDDMGKVSKSETAPKTHNPTHTIILNVGGNY